MSRRLVPVLALFLGLAACKDSDNDGLGNGKEKKLGTDPNAVDSDGDYASDLREVETLGTDPLVPDSDGDGYADGWEDQAGTDPMDENSVIYQGGWPYNPEKDDIVDPGWDGGNDKGDTLPRFEWLDQYGDMVDIYDFAFQGKPIMLDLSEYRCYWCHESAELLEGESTDFDGYGFQGLKEIVEDGDIYWVTVIDGDYQTPSRDVEDAFDDWNELYPNPHVTVLMDEDQVLMDWMDGLGFPTMFLIEEDMTVGIGTDNYTDGWVEVLERYGEECNGEDDDGDGDVDEDATDGRYYYLDGDGDKYGGGAPVWACEQPTPDHTTKAGDCADSDPDRHPGIAEDCLTTTDDDCDGNSNESKADNCTDYFADGDKDGFGSTATCQCKATSSRPVSVGGDCDDADATSNPDGTEVLFDGVDQDCDPTNDNDGDGDGVNSADYWGRDCDDADPTHAEDLCVSEDVITPDAAGGASLFVADEDALYYTAPLAKAVRELPLNGDDALAECAVGGTAGLALNADFVYFADTVANKVSKLDRETGTVTSQLTLTGTPGGMAVTSTRLIVGDGDNLVRQSLNGGSASTLSSAENGVRDIAIDDSTGFWTTGDNRIRTGNVGGTLGATTLASENAYGIGVDAQYVYWVTDAGVVRRLSRSAEAGAPEDVPGVPTVSAQSDVAVLGEWLLISDSTNGTITKVLRPE